MNLTTVPRRCAMKGTGGNYRAVVFFETEAAKIPTSLRIPISRAFRCRGKLMRCAKIFPDAIAASPSGGPPVCRINNVLVGVEAIFLQRVAQNQILMKRQAGECRPAYLSSL